MEPIIAIVLVLVGYALGSAKVISEGNQALVERLGRRHRTLSPGLNFIVPVIDQIVMEDTTREQYIDIKPQNIITKDNIYLEVDAVVFWRISSMDRSFYEIDDLQGALAQLATTTLREIIRVDIQRITPPDSVRKSMEEQRAAEIKSRAAILEAEGERQAAIKKAEGTKTSLQIISEALHSNPENKEILRYLVAQDYVDASHKLSASQNAKIVFMDPVKSGDVYDQLLAETVVQETNKSENGSA